MLLRRCAPSLAGSRTPLAALTRGGPAAGRTWRAVAVPSATRSVVTSLPRWAAVGGDDVLPDLPGAGAEAAGEVGQLYDRYVAEGAARGIVDFVSSPSYNKQREEPLPEVRMSNHSKHALHISRHKLNDICRTIRGLSVHEADVQLYFSQKRVASAVRGLLAKAVRVAKDREGLDQERLVVAQAFVGRDTPLVRRRYHSMSRGGRVHKPRSQLTLVLQEVPHGDRRALGRVVSHRRGRLPKAPRWKKPQ